MLREYSDLFLPTDMSDILTGIQHDLSTGAFWEIMMWAVSGGGASIARFPVVIMTGLPSVFEQKGQLGLCLLPSQPLSVSV